MPCHPVRRTSRLTIRPRARPPGLTLAYSNQGYTVLVRPSEIQRATIGGNHVRVDTVSMAYVIREPMHAVESRLPSSQFVRPNRSVLVNVDAIREIQCIFAAASPWSCATART
jgi:DNA-binding LytR/AlgR family response regulator